MLQFYTDHFCFRTFQSSTLFSFHLLFSLTFFIQFFHIFIVFIRFFVGIFSVLLLVLVFVSVPVLVHSSTSNTVAHRTLHILNTACDVVADMNTYIYIIQHNRTTNVVLAPLCTIVMVQFC